VANCTVASATYKRNSIYFLQPQPNKVPLKGDTKVLCRLLLEFMQLQKTRRVRKQQHKCRLEKRRYPHEADGVGTRSLGNSGGYAFSTANSAIHTDLSCRSNVLPVFLDSFDHEGTFLGAVSSGTEAPITLWPEEQNESYDAPTSTVDFESPATQLTTASSDLPTPFLDWHLMDF
jgi:hypothetical protein